MYGMPFAPPERAAKGILEYRRSFRARSVTGECNKSFRLRQKPCRTSALRIPRLCNATVTPAITRCPPCRLSVCRVAIGLVDAAAASAYRNKTLSVSLMLLWMSIVNTKNATSAVFRFVLDRFRSMSIAVWFVMILLLQGVLIGYSATTHSPTQLERSA